MESLSGLDFDYVLLATLDRPLIERTRQRLTDEGIPAEKILTVVEDIDTEVLGFTALIHAEIHKRLRKVVHRLIGLADSHEKLSGLFSVSAGWPSGGYT